MPDSLFFFLNSEVGQDLNNLKAKKVAVYTDANVSVCERSKRHSLKDSGVL
jgi:hypothetical protein